MDSVDPGVGADQGLAATELDRFRGELYRCLGRRADELFELVDAVLCAEGPVRSLVGLCLAPEHRRGHGALYDAVNSGEVDPVRLRETLVRLPLPRLFGGRIVLAVDVSPWLRPDAATCPDRLFCHVYGRATSGFRAGPISWSRPWRAGRPAGRRCWMRCAWGRPRTPPR
jgi:hypothetical protein